MDSVIVLNAAEYNAATDRVNSALKTLKRELVSKVPLFVVCFEKYIYFIYILFAFIYFIINIIKCLKNCKIVLFLY